MTAFLSHRTLHYKNKIRRFRITDAEGTLLAGTIPLTGGEGLTLRKSLTVFGAFEPALLKIADRSGNPLFLMERPGAEGLERLPAIVKYPDGSELGRIIPGERIDYERKLSAGQYVDTEQFIDAEGNILGHLRWERQHYSGSYNPKYCDYFDAQDTELGRFKFGTFWNSGRSTLQLDQQPPDPLNTLVRLSPIAFELVQVIRT